jgi:hypothetical protein
MNLTFNLFNWVTFIACLLFSYGLNQGIANKYFLVDHEKQTWRNNVENIFLMLVFGSLVFVFGNYNQTFPNIGTVMLMIMIPIVWTIFEIRFGTNTNNNYTGGSIDTLGTWDNNSRKINLTVIITTFILILAHLKLAKHYNILPKFLFFLVVEILIIIILFLTSIGENTNFNLHYWLIGWLLAFFTRFKDSTWSELGAGFALGLFIHGFSVYKNNLIFYENENENENDIYDSTNGDATWYSILIISGILLLLSFSKYTKDKFIK